MFKSIKSTGIAGAMALFAFAGFSAPALADTVTDTFTIDIEILDSCSITNVGDIHFGQVNGADVSTALNQKATLKVECNPLSGGWIGLTPGNSDTTGAGVMTGPNSNTIAYQLYQDNGTGGISANVWGNQDPANTVSITGDITPGPQTFTIWADVTDSGPKATGNYSDTVTVKVTY